MVSIITLCGFLISSYCFSAIVSQRINDFATNFLLILLSQSIFVISLLAGATILSQNSLLVASVISLITGIYLWKTQQESWATASEYQSVISRILQTDNLLWLLIIAVVFAFNLVIPIAEIDTISYHLPVLNHLLETQSVWDVYNAGYVGPNTYFPANHEGFQAFLILIFGNLNFNFLVTLAAVILFYSTLREHFYTLTSQKSQNSKGNTLFLFVSFLAVISVPFLFQQFFQFQVDLFLFALIGASIVFLFQAIIGSETAIKIYQLQRFFLCLGLAIGAKYNAVLQAVFLIPILLIALYQCHQHWRKLWWAPLLSVGTGGIWYLRNLVVTKNPIYPFAANLGPIEFVGHFRFLADLENSSLLYFWQQHDLFHIFNYILQHPYFSSTVGYISSLILPFSFFIILATIGLLIYRRHFKSPILILSLCLLYLFIAQLFAYLKSPYTYTLWHETIRYTSAWFALIPIIFVVAAARSKLLKTIIFLISAFIFSFTIVSNSIFSDSEILNIFQAKTISLSFSHLLIIGFTVFVIWLFAIVSSHYFRHRNRSIILQSLAFLVLTIFLVQVAPFLKIDHRQLDDQYLIAKTIGYQRLLPQIEKLREIKAQEPQKTPKIALVGLTPYWLFQKAGFQPIYINIDGCIECKYPEYRTLESSVRSFPNQQKWLAAINSQNVDYLLIGVNDPHNAKAQLFEKNWADQEKQIFTEVFTAHNITLYQVKR